MGQDVNFVLCGEPKDVKYDELSEVYASRSHAGKNQNSAINNSESDQNGNSSNNGCNDKNQNNKDNNNNGNNKNGNANNKGNNSEKEEIDKEKARDDKISEYGQATLDENGKDHKIHLLSIIGEIEGHECLSNSTKTTKYEHVLPQLATIEDDTTTDGLLILINTVGGDVSCGLALAEMISSLSVPTVSLVIGDSHSIGVPLAVATDYSFIVPTGTMIIHPVRMSGMVIGAPQTFEYFHLIQDRIVGFVSKHSKLPKERMEEMMMKTGILTKDLGTILVGEECVKEGLINEVGGIQQAIAKLHSLIEERKNSK